METKTLTEWVAESEVDVLATFQGYNATEKQFVWTVRVTLPGKKAAFSTPFTCGLAHCKRSKLGDKGPKVKVDHEIAKALTYVRKLSLSDLEGFVVPTPPDAATVMSCLQSDAHAGDNTFEDFCSEFGYDSDSRKAHAIWERCANVRPELRKVLGAHFEAFMSAENDV